MDQWQRRFRDICADCYNYWQKWQALNQQAITIAQSMANDRILLLDPEASFVADPDFDTDAVCDRLSETFTCKAIPILMKFENIEKKLRKMGAEVESMVKLREMSMSGRGTMEDGPDLDKVRELVKLMGDTFDREVKCKKAAFTDLIHAANRDATVVCVACFVHEPFTDVGRVTVLLEGAVVESGHKNM